MGTPEYEQKVTAHMRELITTDSSTVAEALWKREALFWFRCCIYTAALAVVGWTGLLTLFLAR